MAGAIRVKVHDLRVGDNVPGLGVVKKIRKLTSGGKDIYAWVTEDGALFIERAEDSYYVNRKLDSIPSSTDPHTRKLKLEKSIIKDGSVFLEVLKDNGLTLTGGIHVDLAMLKEALENL